MLVVGGADFTTGWALDSAERYYPELPDLSCCMLRLEAAALAAAGVARALW